jgi:hypothetical protein
MTSDQTKKQSFLGLTELAAFCKTLPEFVGVCLVSTIYTKIVKEEFHEITEIFFEGLVDNELVCWGSFLQADWSQTKVP